MSFKYYFRKSSFKKDIESANILLNQVESYKPKNFLEVGVFQGVTSRNICEKLNIINDGKFSFHGIDIFEDTNNTVDKKEMTTKHNKLSNPFKHIYFNYMLRENPNTIESVKNLLKKFQKSVFLYKGYSQSILKNLDISEIDFVF